MELGQTSEKMYYYDIDAIVNYVLNGTDDCTENTDIMDLYTTDDKTQLLTLVNRQITESKTKKNDSNTAIRYDLIKNFIANLSDLEINPTKCIPLFYQEVAFNTLANKGFIKTFDENGQ